MSRTQQSSASAPGRESGAARPLPEDPEAAITAALARADYRGALTLLDELHGAGLYRYVRQMVGADDVADDVWQITFVQAFRDLPRFSGRSSLKTWLYSIARHRCLDTLKARRRREKRIALPGDVPDEADGSPGPDQRLDDRELAAALDACVQELPTHVRMVVLLRYQEGFSYQEIERVCRERPATLRAGVSRAMPLLRRCLEGKGTV